MTERELLKDKKRIVIKIGSSSLTHAETGDLNLAKIEKLVRVISDMRGMGKEVISETLFRVQPDGGTDPDHKGDDPGRYFPRKREKYVQ